MISSLRQSQESIYSTDLEKNYQKIFPLKLSDQLGHYPYSLTWAIQTAVTTEQKGYSEIYAAVKETEERCSTEN